MYQLRPLESLGGDENQWLKARHHFAVSALENPTHMPLGHLVILNDDEISAGAGFPMHRHRDMEIVTYVREGTLEHEDSLGNVGHVAAGNVQAFSAGTGIRHAERNSGKTPLRLFQIWIKPRQLGIVPRWETRFFPRQERANTLVPLASGITEDAGAVFINADARVMSAMLEAGATISYAFGKEQLGYLVVAAGEVSVGEMVVTERSGLAIKDEEAIAISARKDAELVFVVCT
ncbi:pirin family protein [Herbaspirillum sp. LeCh32-8]|uniref:pirin family protein n=1 Tax=Herbaspirillum sp. LeCh32-8 TaxID=2821356 RepID=UPI001AE572A0|nr:pirin-like bicupin family protein [Herbaspirillum sp. LeCh32-8]MBP0600738.1 pirin family protein [Herbaspirillum sp. LeCh32-8]